MHAGIVDLASFNVMNAVIGAGAAPRRRLAARDAWRPKATTLAICAATNLMFYRHRAAVDEEPLSALVHQTAMYHEDRLGGTRFSRVWLCGRRHAGRAAEQARRDIARSARVAGRRRWTCAPRGEFGDDGSPSADVLDALAAPVGRAAARSEGGLTSCCDGNLSTRPFYNERLVTLA